MVGLLKAILLRIGRNERNSLFFPCFREFAGRLPPRGDSPVPGIRKDQSVRVTTLGSIHVDGV
jgi:hypothetical protein